MTRKDLGPQPEPEIEPGEPNPGGVDAVDTADGVDGEFAAPDPDPRDMDPEDNPAVEDALPGRDEAAGGHLDRGDRGRGGRDQHRAREGVPGMSSNNEYDVTESDQDVSGDIGVSSGREGHAGPGQPSAPTGVRDTSVGSARPGRGDPARAVARRRGDQPRWPRAQGRPTPAWTRARTRSRTYTTTLTAAPSRGGALSAPPICTFGYGGPKYRPHPLGVEHHVLPREAQHQPAIDGKQVVAPRVIPQRGAIAMPFERVGLQHDPQVFVHEVGSAEKLRPERKSAPAAAP